MKLYTEPVDCSLSAAALHGAAYALLKRALRADYGVTAPEIQKTPQGKPYLAGANMPFFSISHTRGLVCCAVADTPCGVDCEGARAVPPRVLRRVCTEAELLDIAAHDDRALAYWMLKEAVSKKTGLGFAGGFRQIEIHYENGRPVCAGHRLHLEVRGGFLIAAAE